MDSNKSNDPQKRRAVEPQRRPGKERVARLLEVGAAVIAEKGYEGATMAEIAERAGSPIGSLYRFFPSKEILADALIQGYESRIAAAFTKIDAEAASASSTEQTADVLLHFLVNRQHETKAMRALLEGRTEWSARRQQIRRAALKHIAHTLTLLAPALPATTAADMAVVLLHCMKTMAALEFREDVPQSAGAMEELRLMNRLYVAHRLAPFRRGG